MKLSINKDNSTLAVWPLSLLIALGLAALTPHLAAPPSPALHSAPPFVPRFRYVAAPVNRQDGEDAEELNAIRSPSLISLPNDIIRPARWENEERHFNLIAPPSGIMGENPLFLAAPVNLAGEPDLPYPAISPSFKPEIRLPFPSRSSAGDPARGSENSGVMMSQSGGLAGISIDCPALSLTEWTAPGGSWFVTVKVGFDRNGKPLGVFLETPAPEKSINEQAIRTAYRCRLSTAGGEAEGLITFWFHGGETKSVDNSKGIHTGS